MTCNKTFKPGNIIVARDTLCIIDELRDYGILIMKDDISTVLAVECSGSRTTLTFILRTGNIIRYNKKTVHINSKRHAGKFNVIN